MIKNICLRALLMILVPHWVLYSMERQAYWKEKKYAIYFHQIIEQNDIQKDGAYLATGYPLLSADCLQLRIGYIPWPSVEHYVQAQKFCHNTALFNQIVMQRDIGSLLRKADELNDQIRPDWSTKTSRGIVRKDVIMLTGLWAKFTQNVNLQERLIKTMGRLLIYQDNDRYWGCGQDYTGCNYIGQMLMHIRSTLLESRYLGGGLPRLLFDYTAYKPSYVMQLTS